MKLRLAPLLSLALSPPLDSWFWERVVAAWRAHPGGGSAVLVPDLLGCGASERWEPSERGIFVPLDW